MSNFLILHGTDGSPASNWYMWLKGILIGRGHTVWLPQLPNASKPNAEAYTKFLLDNKTFTYDADTVIVGHSSGAVAALNLLQHLPTKTKVQAAVLVSAFNTDLGWDSLSELFPEPFNYELIQAHCEYFTFIHSDDDPYSPIAQAETMAEQTGGDLVVIEGQGHFNTELNPQYKQFPELLGILDTIV